ncbi:MAG: hypothetical protein QGH07_02295 [Alphaproteobacteria bacterium]|nr:hypothetical protein [Alphaproteobacteria bacterium]
MRQIGLIPGLVAGELGIFQRSVLAIQTEDIVAAIPIAILKLSVTRYLLRLGEIGYTVGHEKTDLGSNHKSAFVRVGVLLTVQRT